MIKKIFKLLILIFFIIISFTVYLSFIGINTDKFNNQIKKQIKDINDNFEVELKKVNILLDPFEFVIKAKTIGTNLRYKDKVVKLESIKSTISIKSLIDQNPKLKDLTISTKLIEIKNLISFLRNFNNDAKFYLAEKIVNKGFIVANVNLEFDKDGKIKNNFRVNGFVKDGKISFFKENYLSKIDFNFNFKENEINIENMKLFLDDNEISLPYLKSINKNKINFISGKIKNKKIFLEKGILFDYIKRNFLKDGIENLEFLSDSDFNFQLNNKFKVKNLNIKSNIELNNLILINKYDLSKFFPNQKKKIILNNHEIAINYVNDQLNISGNGKISIQKKADKIKYNILKTQKDLKFDTEILIKENFFILDFLNYEKSNNKDLVLNLKGNYNSNHNIFFELIKLKEEENSIFVSNLLLTKNNQVKKFDKLFLDYLDKDDLINKIEIINTKNKYYLKGKSLNINKIVENILNPKNEKKSNFFKDNFFLKLDIESTYLDSENIIENLKGYLSIKKNEITDASIESVFLNNKKIKYTVKTINNEKITTFFSEYPKPIVERYRFIKGFEKGILDFYSLKKNGISKSELIIDNFKLKEVPVLAKILTLASLQGIADLLTGEGIRFTDFEMKFTSNKDLMTIDEMYAIGPAISILLEGYIETKKLISLRGTLVPATTINRSIASIPLIGDILVGKKVGEGVFGVSFKIKGPPGKLETSVNPIKTLTPRFITRTLEKIKKN